MGSESFAYAIAIWKNDKRDSNWDGKTQNHIQRSSINDDPEEGPSALGSAGDGGVNAGDWQVCSVVLVRSVFEIHGEIVSSDYQGDDQDSINDGIDDIPVESIDNLEDTHDSVVNDTYADQDDTDIKWNAEAALVGVLVDVDLVEELLSFLCGLNHYNFV